MPEDQRITERIQHDQTSQFPGGQRILGAVSGGGSTVELSQSTQDPEEGNGDEFMEGGLANCSRLSEGNPMFLKALPTLAVRRMLVDE